MPRKPTKPATAARAELALEGELTIYTAAQQHQLLLAWATGASGSGAVNLARVTECDSAGLQLLLAARATLAEQGCAIALHEPSRPVREVLDLYALGTDLRPLAAETEA